jgi:hypothetical protein
MAIPSSAFFLISRSLFVLLTALLLVGTAPFEFQIKDQSGDALTAETDLQQQTRPTVCEQIEASLNGKTPGEAPRTLAFEPNKNFFNRRSEFTKLNWVNSIHKMTHYGFSCLCGGVANA